MRTIAFVAVCASFILTSCRSMTPTAAVGVDGALATLVPADTAVLVGARLDKLRETPVYKKHFSQVPLPRLDDFVKETGLDPRKDLSEVLFASNGTQSGVLMVRGKFSTTELESKLEKQGSARTRYKDHNLLGDQRNSVFFLNSSTALAGSTPVLKNIIDHRGGEGIPSTLQPQVNAIPANSQFWAAFSGSAIRLPFASDSNLGNINKIIQSIENGRFSADLQNGFEFQASGSCDTEASAKQINETLRGLIGFGRLSAPENQPELLRVYDGINVKQQGRVVNVAANIPPDVVEKFIDSYVESRR